jgi:hypothetical protein
MIAQHYAKLLHNILKIFFSPSPLQIRLLNIIQENILQNVLLYSISNSFLIKIVFNQISYGSPPANQDIKRLAWVSTAVGMFTIGVSTITGKGCGTGCSSKVTEGNCSGRL